MPLPQGESEDNDDAPLEGIAEEREEAAEAEETEENEEEEAEEEDTGRGTQYPRPF